MPLISSRRGFLRGLGVALAALAIIRTPGLLMPVRPVLAAPMPLHLDIESMFHESSRYQGKIHSHTIAYGYQIVTDRSRRDYHVAEQYTLLPGA